MKQILCTMLVTLFLTSCSSSKKLVTTDKDSSTHEVTNNTHRAEVTESTTATNNLSDTPSHLNVGAAAQVNGATGAMNNQLAKSSATKKFNDDSTLFNALGMTNEQMNAFKAAMNRFKKQQKTTASGEMMGSVESERNRQLKDILTADQYHKYEKLVKSGS